MNTGNHKDYYEMLGLNSNANQQEIKDAYRKLAFQYHPDRNKDDPAASDKMKALNEAYAVLSNESKRREYDILKDRYGATAAYDQYRQSHTANDIFQGSDIGQIFQEFSKAYGFRNADELFREFYGPGFKGFVYSGGPGTPALSPFAQMGFTGRVLKFIMEKVLRIPVPERGRDLYDTVTLTAETVRLGGELEYHYRKREETKNLMLKIPAGIQSGQAIRLRGLGAYGKAGGTPGDLLLRVKVKVTLWQRIRGFFRI
jgi:DnaJ-class molecular chaperone